VSRSTSISSPEHGRVLPLLLLLFIGSGCAALIYEIVWLQMLQLVVGLTSLSLGVLLGTFMGGMCIGSLLLPKYISRSKHPLMVYAWLELGIGALGLLVLFGMPLIESAYASVTGHGLIQSVMFRAIVGGICLVPPTILMGATLPAIARWVETSPRGISWMGFFYGGNIVGAVIGCLVTGFYLLRVYDTAIATYVALSLNILVALCAMIISKFTAHEASQPESEPMVYANESKMVYVAIALSGMGALGAEVIWTRLLAIMLGATVYTFSIILGVFLVGLGIGSTAGSHLAKDMTNPRQAFAICQLLLILAIGWAAYIIAFSLPYWPINPALATSTWFTFQLDLTRVAFAVLPSAILWGASFPIALASVAAKGQDPGKLVGGVYAANTVGAILGSWLFSFIGLPIWGTQLSEKIIMIIAGVASLVMFAPFVSTEKSEGKKSSALRFAGISVGVIALVTLLVSHISTVPWGAVAYGRYMATYGRRLAEKITPAENIPNYETLQEGQPDIYALYVGEGLNGSVAVTQWSSGVRNFHSAGKVQASTDPQDMRLQRMLGHLSALGVEKPESVLVVACGAGVTAGTFVTHPTVKEIVICDIESLVPKVVTPMFSSVNYGITDGIAEHNPHMVNGKQVRVEYDDGRHYISTSDEKFDVITSDPIDPWVKGSAALNTVEYYEMCKAHLKPGGVMSLWIPLYESDQKTIKSVIATFFKVFPNGVLFSNDYSGEGFDAVLFGQAEGTKINIDSLQARLDRPDHAMVKHSLEEVSFPSAASLMGTYAAQPSDLSEWMSDAQINTDRNLRLQYLAGMSLNNYYATDLLEGIMKYYRFPTNVFTGSETQIQSLKIAISRNGRYGNGY